MTRNSFDTVVVGGGAAGLAAALWLGRYRRGVVVFDAGDPRNKPAWAVHGYPGLADPSPLELRRLLREQALAAGAEMRACEIISVEGQKDAFIARSDAGAAIHCRRILLAYGLRDYVPDVDGLGELYGTSVFHCPDCDGPSVADSRVGVIGWDRHAANQALFLLTWTRQITLLTNAQKLELTDKARAALNDQGVAIREERIARLVGSGGVLKEAQLAGAEPIALDAAFFHLGSEPRCSLAEQLECELDSEGFIKVDRGQETSCAGVHAAGDITGQPHLASIAAAEGVRAALAIHRSLLPETRHT